MLTVVPLNLVSKLFVFARCTQIHQNQFWAMEVRIATFVSSSDDQMDMEMELGKKVFGWF